jgi:division protein CdvB (Snf7/Vps24/ESCRT-III family)
MNAISKRYARINIQIEQTDSSEERIQSWVTMLDDAVNWSTSSDYTIFFMQVISI